MRRSFLLLGLPLLLLSAPASAHDSGHEDDPDPESYDARKKIEIGINLEGYRSSSQLAGASGVTGGYLGMHGRFGRRIALGFGVDQGYGQDATGYQRFDIAWNLPKLYLYLNPASKSQLYVTTGLDMRVSHFEDGPNKVVPSGTPWGFFYFGSFIGGGVEHRLDKGMALRLETRWFMRGRTGGDGSATHPLDPTFAKETANQRGGVVTLGLTFF